MSLEPLSLSRILPGASTFCCHDNTVLVRNLLQPVQASYRDLSLRQTLSRPVCHIVQCTERREHCPIGIMGIPTTGIRKDEHMVHRLIVHG